MSEDRLTLKELRRKEQMLRIRKAYETANANKTSDRLTTRDLQKENLRDTYIKAQEETMKQMRDRMTQRDVETFQNDRTKPLPREAYEQVDQELTYPDEVEGKKSGGIMNCKGGRKAIGGTKFTGVK